MATAAPAVRSWQSPRSINPLASIVNISSTLPGDPLAQVLASARFTLVAPGRAPALSASGFVTPSASSARRIARTGPAFFLPPVIRTPKASRISRSTRSTREQPKQSVPSKRSLDSDHSYQSRSCRLPLQRSPPEQTRQSLRPRQITVDSPLQSPRHELR